MKNDFLNFIKSIPKWRVFLVFLLSIFFTYITAFFISGYISYLLANSVTLSSLNFALIDIIGPRKYEAIIEFIFPFSKVFHFIIFLSYLYLFYRREKKKHYQENLFQIMREIGFIAAGNFDHKINASPNSDLNLLAIDINNIVLQLKASMDEERHIEHTKNELITNVSHDLRTPLTSIIGYLGLIEQDKYRDEVELRRYTGIAYEKAVNLETLINELFEYTRMQDKRYKLNRVPIDIKEILGQIISQNRLHFKDSGLECREYLSMEKMVVLGDGDKLARVFVNLIMNAITYGKAGTFIDVTALEENNWIIVTITNYGEPIPSIDIPHIFERFYRVEKSRSKNAGGTGLGLAIAKNIITLHDGTIEAVSDVEKTSFTIKLKKIENDIDMIS